MQITRKLFILGLVTASLACPTAVFAQGSSSGQAQLTPQQRQQVRQILQKYRQKQKALREDMNAELSQILSAEQLKALKERFAKGRGGSGQGRTQGLPKPKDDDDDE